MLRRGSVYLMPQVHRSRGYWAVRTPTTRVQDRVMKAPLLTERPYPLSEIVRRMVRIRCKFEDSLDFNERALLRGEYKYYTGKVADIRRAECADMVALLDCYAFFGFWDQKLLYLVLDRLFEKASLLDTLELLLLYRALSQLHLTSSDLYSEICERLRGMSMDQLSIDEAVSLLEHAMKHTPQRLLKAVLFGKVLSHLESIDAVRHGTNILKGLALLDPNTAEDADQEAVVGRMARYLLREASHICEELTAQELARSLHFAAILGVLDTSTRHQWSTLLDRFIMTAGKAADPGSIALVVEACSAYDRTIVLRLCDVILKQQQLEGLSPDISVVFLESAVELIRCVPAGDVAYKLLSDVVGLHRGALSNAMHLRGGGIVSRTLDALARIPINVRARITLYHQCVQAAFAVVMATATRLDGVECINLLEKSVALGTAVSETALTAVLNRLVSLASSMDTSAAGELLRQFHAVPPLPTAATRALAQHAVLPALLKRADGAAL